METTRTLAMAAFVFTIALTPLGPVLNGGVHEAWLPGSQFPSSWGRVRVIVQDHTGLVAGIGATDQAPPPSTPDDRLLVVSWLGGCSDQIIRLSFRAVGAGYRIDKHAVGNGCPFMIGIGRRVTMVTRAPVDPSMVEFDELEASIR